MRKINSDKVPENSDNNQIEKKPESTIPGFELSFIIVGLLAVALRKRLR